jgi:hypothetical protein
VTLLNNVECVATFNDALEGIGRRWTAARVP